MRLCKSHGNGKMNCKIFLNINFVTSTDYCDISRTQNSMVVFSFFHDFLLNSITVSENKSIRNIVQQSTGEHLPILFALADAVDIAAGIVRVHVLVIAWSVCFMESQ